MNRKKAAVRTPVKADEAMVLSHPAQLRALGSPVRVAVFELLVHGPATARALARSLGVPVTRLYHHLRILHGAGLIEVVGIRRVRGTTERTYAAAAKELRLDPALVGGPLPEGAARGAIRAAFRLAEDELVEAVAAGLGSDVLVEQQGVRLDPAAYRRLRKRLLRWLDDLRAAHRPGAKLPVRATIALHRSLPPGPSGREPKGD